MSQKSPRVAVRAILVHDGKLLMVNAYADGRMGLMCAPGGGVERGSSLPDNLCREVYEETGLRIDVGAPCLVNEFHDPKGDFHQIDIYFRCTLRGSAQLNPTWEDTDKIVNDRRWLSQADLNAIAHKPDSLGTVAFGGDDAVRYDPLEPILR